MLIGVPTVPFLICLLAGEKAVENDPSPWAPAIPHAAPAGVLGFRLQSGPFPGFEANWGENQRVEDLSLCLSLFL